MGFYSKKVVPIVLTGIIGNSGTGYAQESELIDNTMQVSQNCSESEREPLDLFFRRMGNQEEITVYWPEESYEDILDEEMTKALEIINQYIEDNNIGIGRLIKSEDENSDIRIRNIETYIHDIISDGDVDSVELFFAFLFSFSHLGLTTIEDRNNLTRYHLTEELCSPDHIMIILANYGPVESSGNELFEQINSLTGETPEDFRYYALGNSAGDIICINSSILSNYPPCTEKAHRLIYRSIGIHEILYHGLGIRGHDSSYIIDENTESGVRGAHLVSLPLRINITDGFNLESGLLVVPELSTFIRVSLIEIHVARE